MVTNELFPGSALDEELTRIKRELSVIHKRIDPPKPVISYLPGWLWAIAIYGSMAYLFWKFMEWMFL